MGRRKFAGCVRWKNFRPRHRRIYNIIVYHMEIFLESLNCIAVAWVRKSG